MCVLRATGAEFDVDQFLATSSLEPCAVFRRGAPRRLSKTRGSCFERSGLKVAVSEGTWSGIEKQTADAERFLAGHRMEVERLVATAGVTDIALDFPVSLRIGENEVMVQSDRFPVSLVRIAGTLGVALELTIYPCEASDAQTD